MKKTKRSLFTSLVTLLLCSAMFVGSTFAWFTDTVSNTGNKIQAGTLDVELWQKTETLSSDQTADTQHVKTITEEGYEEYSNISDSTVAVFNYDKWEPGYSTPTGFAIKNKGNLALKYELTFYLIDSKTGLEQLEVDKSSLTPEQYADKLAHLSKEKVNASSKLEEAIEVYQGETKLGTLKDFFDGRQSFTGHLSAGKVFKTSDLKLIMPTDKGNKYENASISFDIRVLATQYTEEKDGFGSNQYDALADETPDHADWERFKTLASDTKTIKNNEDTVFKTNNNIAEDKQGYTEVTVPKEVVAFFPGKDTTMEVETTPILAANNLFTVTTGEGSVGAIDLTVTVDGIQINEFKDETGNFVPVKVVTYVAKNMTDVTLSYNDDERWTQVDNEEDVDEIGELYYDKTTGKLVYLTQHFSTFVLGANEVAYLDSNNTAYLTLKEAFEKAGEKDTLTLLKNADMNSDHATVNKDLTFDLNNKTANMQTIFVKEGANFELKGDGKLNAVKDGNWTEAVYITDGNLILSGIDITANAGYSGVVSFSNEDESNPAEKQMNLIVSDNTVNSITSTGRGGSAIMLMGYHGDLVSCIKGNGVGTGKLIATAKTEDAWSAIRMCGGGATAKVTISGFNGTFISESDTDYRSLEQGYGNTILVKDMTSGRFSHDETQFMQPGYMTKLNSEGTYDIVLVGEDDATCKIIASDGTTTYIAGSIYQALNLAPENSTITLLKDHEVDTYNSQPLIANNLTVDLNNKTVSGSYGLSIKKPDTNPEHNYNVCEPIYVTIKNGTMKTSTRFEENSHITYENVKFMNTKTSYETGVTLYSDLNTSIYTWASSAENSISFEDCEFENYNVKLIGRNEPQKIDATFTNCTFTKNISASDSVVVYGDTYGYGTIEFDNCIFNTSFNNTYYPVDVKSTTSSIGDKTIDLTIKDTSINVTGSETKPVNSGIATVKEQGKNSYKVNDVEVNYDGTPKQQ